MQRESALRKPILLVQTRPVSAEREDEFNDYYVTRHLADVLTIPGYGSATHYVRHSTRPPAGLHRPPNEFYVTIYELDTDDVDAAAQSLKDAHGRIFGSDAVDRERLLADYYVPLGHEG